MPFQVWKRRKRRRRRSVSDDKARRVEPVTEIEEGLTGYVNNKRASSLEEMYARALRRQDIRFQFRKLIWTPYQVPGQNYEVDFILFEGTPWPVEIDEEWIHRTQAQQDEDALRDTLINDILVPKGYRRITRYKVTMDWTQEDFDRLVEEQF